MKQSLSLNFVFSKNLMMRGFRLLLSFYVIVLCASGAFASEKSIDLAKSVKSKDYQAVVDHLKTVKRKLTVKERMYQALSYGKTGELNLKVESLRAAVKQHPSVDLFKRELAKAIELKADSYAATKNYSKIKDLHYSESAEILSTLYKEKPSASNFTALLQYYNRRGLFEETVGLLDVYGRVKEQGKIFYTYMCEAQYKATLYSGALKSCEKLVEFRPDYPEGHVYLTKTISALGEKDLADKNIVKLASRFPASAPVQFEAGKVLIEKGESAKGLELLERHLKVDSSDEALVLKAETQFKKGDESDALETFIKACKQHKEPRRPLLEKMKTAYRGMASTNNLKKQFGLEVSRCRYSYRPPKKAPKGILGGSYKIKN